MSLIRFADFAADARTGELKRDGRRVRLPRQSFQILVALTRSPGELVTRETLQAELWPATSQVEWEQGLNAAVNRLREALGDSAAEPKFIETLPRRGYRFIGTLASDAVTAPPAAAANMGGTVDTLPAPRTSRTGMIAALVAVLAALILSGGWLSRREDSRLRPGQLKPFTSLPGEERAPAFAPDGMRIAFAWNGERGSGGRFDLFVKAMDSEKLLRLTDTPSDWLHPAWSPDGASIAFARQLDGATGIYLVPSIGGAERRLAQASFVSEPFMQVAWSADGKTLGYAGFDGSGSHVIQLLDVATLEIRRLAPPPDCWHAGMPAFSAGGHRLAFLCTSSVGVFTVYSMELADGQPRAIRGFPGEPQGLAWELDDQGIIVASDSGEGGTLWHLALDGRTTRLPFGEESAAPTRSGRRLAYARAHSPVDIWRMDLTAPDPLASAERLIYSTRRDVTPQFSADGRHIVFQSNRSGHAEIWMVDAAGANPLRLTQFNGPQTGAPSFCADGKRVALDSRPGGHSQLFIVDVEERQPRQVETTERELGIPVWSADCQWLLASDGRARLFKVPAAGGPASLFTQQKSYHAQVAGDLVVFNVKRQGGVQLWSRLMAGGEEKPLDGLPLIGYREAWVATRAGVFFTASQPGPPTLQFYDFATQAVKRLAALPRTPVPGGGLGMAVSADGRWGLFTQPGEAASDIMLLEMIE